MPTPPVFLQRISHEMPYFPSLPDDCAPVGAILFDIYRTQLLVCVLQASSTGIRLFSWMGPDREGADRLFTADDGCTSSGGPVSVGINI